MPAFRELEVRALLSNFGLTDSWMLRDPPLALSSLATAHLITMPGWKRWGREQISCKVNINNNNIITNKHGRILQRGDSALTVYWNQAYLCVNRLQLLGEQLGVRVTDVPDAQEALQATRQPDCHLKVRHLLHTAQHQHAFLHILPKTPQLIKSDALFWRNDENEYYWGVFITLICRISTRFTAALSARAASFSLFVFCFLDFLASSLAAPFLFLVSAGWVGCKRNTNYFYFSLIHEIKYIINQC